MRVAFALLHFEYSLFSQLPKSAAGVLTCGSGLLTGQVTNLPFRYPTVIDSKVPRQSFFEARTFFLAKCAFAALRAFALRRWF